MNSTKRLLRWTPFTAGVAFILWAAGQPSPGAGIPVWDKAMHFAAYTVLGWMAQFAFHPGTGRSRVRVILAVASSMLCAILDEWLQQGTPGRDASILDGLADFAGIGFASIIWFRHNRRGETVT